MSLNPEASLGLVGDGPEGEGSWLVCGTLSHLDIYSSSEAMGEKGSGLKLRSEMTISSSVISLYLPVLSLGHF